MFEKIPFHRLNAPHKRVLRMIAEREEQNFRDKSVELYTRRSLSKNYPRIRKKTKGSRKERMIGCSYQSMCRLVNDLIEDRYIMEANIKVEPYGAKGLIIATRFKPKERMKVIVAARKSKKRTNKI